MKTVVSLLNGSKHHGIQFPPELLQRMVVVLSQNVESFQVYQCLVQWHGVTPDGRGHDCWTPFGQQYVGSVFGGGGHGSQRMERF